MNYRDLINGIPKMRQGVTVATGLETYKDAETKIKELKKTAAKGETFCTNGVLGRLCILKYGAKLVPVNYTR